MVLKKSKLGFILLVVILGVSIFAVTPASAETRNIVLWDATVTPNRGLVLTFKLYGDFNKFSGNVWFSGQSYGLNCHVKNTDDSILICQGSSRGLDTLAHQTVQVVVNGFSFTTYVTVDETNPQICIPVYDYLGSPDSPIWWQVGTECSDTTPEFGSEKYFDTSVDSTFYEYNGGGFCGPGGSFNNYGDAWYYPDCDEEEAL